MENTDSRRVVITGANRGLGLEFTRALLARGDRVVAGCRRPAAATALTALAADYPGQLHVLPLEVDVERSRGAFARELADLHESLDLLINNAGMLTPGEQFGEMMPEVLERTLATNTVAPMMLAQWLLPLLAKGDRPRILNIGSALGSVARAQRFGTPSYNISKAGLNMAGVLMARALNPHGIGVLTISPGWVKTEMGGSGAELTPEESVRDVLATLERTPGVPEGYFLDRNGAPLPW